MSPLTWITFVIIFVICLTCIACSAYFNKAKIVNVQARGLGYIRKIRSILELGQKHRGLSHGFLNGDATLKSDINEIQKKLFSQISAIEFNGSQAVEWNAISSQWKNIADTYSTQTVTDNFESHVNWIYRILDFIEEVAETHYLLRVKDFDQYNHNFLWKDFLQAIEFMGQARALGTGVAASGKCNSVDKIRLNYLFEKIDHAVKEIERITPFSSDIKTRVNTFLKYMSNDLYQSPIQVTPQEYFEIATFAISSMYDYFEKILKSAKI